ncbi:MAG: tyrosine-type recombinase/integrase [Phycisphaeraceae bacterium]|nr:tyrosine-type recombinase/integrase [Phycisphaeraceae bacterium]
MNLRQQRDQYIESLRASGRSTKTVRCYEERIDQFITYLTETFYPVDVPAEVQLTHVQQYHDHLIDDELSVSTRRTYLATVRGFLQWHQSHSSKPSNLDWLDQIEIPKRPYRLPPTALSIDEVCKLIAASKSPRNKAILTVMYACGLRRSEVVALNVGDLFVNRQQLLVHGKGGKDRIVPIAPAAIRAIADYLDTRSPYPASGEAMFTAEPPRAPRRLDSNYLSILFKRLSTPTGKHVNPHLLRHTFAVHLLRGGADVRHVQALLGHSSPDTTNQYLGLVKDEMKRAYDRAMKTIVQRNKPEEKPIKRAA